MEFANQPQFHEGLGRREAVARTAAIRLRLIQDLNRETRHLLRLRDTVLQRIPVPTAGEHSLVILLVGYSR